MCLIGHGPKLDPRSAALFRELRSYVDSADVLGVDDGLLSREDAMHLRALGWLVLDEEIEKPVQTAPTRLTCIWDDSGVMPSAGD